MTDRTNLLRVANTGLLLVIAIILVLILRSIPKPGPTQADIEKARKSNDWKLQSSLLGKMPKVSIEGAVEVISNMDDPIFIQTDPTGGHPLKIDSLPPIEVKIVHP